MGLLSWRGGEVEEGLLQVGVVLGDLVDDEAGGGDGPPDGLGGGAVGEHEVGARQLGFDAVGVECGAQRGGLRGADAHHRAGARELGQRGVGDEPSGDQHDDLVDGLGHFGQQMAGDQHGASRGGVAAHEVAQPADPFGVETVGGLVQHEDLGLAEQGGGEPEPLTHAEREAADASPGDRRSRPTSASTSSTRSSGRPAVAARTRRCSRARRPGWKLVASSTAPM